MRLTQMTDFALRLLMYAARQGERRVTIAEVAEVHGLSEAHLMKITHLLAQAGYLETVRGKGGGMRLARAPAQIRLGDVVRDLEPDFALVECFGDGSQCTLGGSCRLAGVIDGALQAFLAHLDAHTLADVVATATPIAVAPPPPRAARAPDPPR